LIVAKIRKSKILTVFRIYYENINVFLPFYREAKERAIRIASKPAPLPRPSISSYIEDASEMTQIEQLAFALNKYCDEYSHSNKMIKAEKRFPLYMYDSSLFDEIMNSPVVISENMECVCLLCDDTSLIGVWRPCFALSKLENGMYQVRNTDGDSSSDLLMGRVQIYFVCDSFPIICDRISAALDRRHTAVSLLHYYHQIRCMPSDLTVSSAISPELIKRIKNKWASFPLDTDVTLSFAEEMQMVSNDFLACMNRIMYNAKAKATKKDSDSFTGKNAIF
jgi:hypothetical protein